MELFSQKKLQILFIVVVICLPNLSVQNCTASFDYCTITCNGHKHTMCEYPAGGGPLCGNFTHGVTNEIKKILVQMHNDLRQTVASGKGDGHVQAANMMALTWSDEAQRVAQRWADQCSAQSAHDVCRTNCDGEPGGQNVALHPKLDKYDIYQMQEQLVMDWYKYGKAFKSESLGSYKEDPNTDPFVQIVWAQSTKIGCGFSQGSHEDTEVYTLVCNYYPGPKVGSPVYVRGPPCSKCPGKCSTDFPALCTSSKSHVWNRASNSTATGMHVSLVERCTATLSVFVLFSIK